MHSGQPRPLRGSSQPGDRGEVDTPVSEQPIGETREGARDERTCRSPLRNRGCPRPGRPRCCSAVCTPPLRRVPRCHRGRHVDRDHGPYLAVELAVAEEVIGVEVEPPGLARAELAALDAMFPPRSVMGSPAAPAKPTTTHGMIPPTGHPPGGAAKDTESLATCPRAHWTEADSVQEAKSMGIPISLHPRGGGDG